jgi:hypothetical protein
MPNRSSSPRMCLVTVLHMVVYNTLGERVSPVSCKIVGSAASRIEMLGTPQAIHHYLLH